MVMMDFNNTSDQQTDRELARKTANTPAGASAGASAGAAAGAAAGSNFTKPDLSVLVVNWNTRDLLENCLASIEQNRDSLYLEVIVVDNASTDGSIGMVEQRFPEVILVANKENLGFARANNQAMRMARGRFVLLLNSDTVVQPDALSHMVQFLDANEDVGIVGAQLLNADHSLQPSWASFPNLLSELVGKNFRFRRSYSTVNRVEAYAVDWVGGAALMARRSLFKALGGLDESYYMYSEEMDWCYRTRHAGWDVCYLPQAKVIHLGGQSSRKASTKMKTELYLSKLIFFDKHYGRRQARLLGMGLRVLWQGKAFIRSLTGARRNDDSSESAENDTRAMIQMVNRFFQTHSPVHR